jgi:hypothetical protein
MIQENIMSFQILENTILNSTPVLKEVSNLLWIMNYNEDRIEQIGITNGMSYDLAW